MGDAGSHARDLEVAEILMRLRREVEARPPASRRSVGSGVLESSPAGRDAQRVWAVSAERPYLFRPGRLGRVRGLALLPLKAVLRRLMRWYVEPLATDQRAFNAAVLRLLDELAAEVSALQQRLAELEGTSQLDESPGRAAPGP